MRQWCKDCSNKGIALLALGLTLAAAPAVQAEAQERPTLRLRIAVVNPSPIIPQQVSVRWPLPAEVIPRHILDLDGLSIDYDLTQARYYVHHEAVTLAPGEVQVFDVVVEDLWVIPEAELRAVRRRAARVADHHQSARPVAEAIDRLVEAITAVQQDETISQTQHIQAYRLNREAMARMRAELAQVESLLGGMAVEPAPVVAPPQLWWMALVGLLGGAAMAWHWRRQSKSVSGTGRQQQIGAWHRRCQAPHKEERIS